MSATPGAAQAAHVVVASAGRGASSRNSDARRQARPDRPTEPSSSAGSSSPTTDATAITPAAKPHSSGRRAAARSPSRKTGIAPSPVASAVAVPARISPSMRRPWRASVRRLTAPIRIPGRRVGSTIGLLE